MSYFIVILISCLFVLNEVLSDKENENHEDGGYSFHEFSGPVSGEVREIQVPRGPHGVLKTDFVAKPDYKFSYGVDDPQSGTAQAHRESRDGDAVHGEYSVLQADGNMRIVRYTADAVNGFQATVEYKPV